MKIKVNDGIQVTHDGTSWRGGQMAEVPDAVARLWIASGWVTEAPTPKPRRKTTTTK